MNGNLYFLCICILKVERGVRCECVIMIEEKGKYFIWIWVFFRFYDVLCKYFCVFFVSDDFFKYGIYGME